MKRITSVVNDVGRGVRGLVLVAALCLGCSSDPTDPGPGPVEIAIAYTPLNPNVSLIVGENRSFTANVTGTDSYTVSWSVGGTEVGTGSLFTYEGQYVGTEELAVEVTAGEVTDDRTWNLLVEANKSELPPVVPNLDVDHGAEPAQVVVEWDKLEGPYHPLSAYLVAISYTGEIVDEATWAAADQVVETPVGADIQQEVTLDAAIHDIRPGEEAWFTVRARDDVGQLSDVPKIPVWLTITTAWTLEVAVRDDVGAPVAIQLVEYQCTNCGTAPANAVTDNEGNVSLGPFRSIDTVVVTTNSSDETGGALDTGWFDYTSPPQDMNAGPLEIVLINRWGVADLEPCALYADFMEYVVHMSRRSVSLPLYRWENYPLQVHAQSFLLDGEDLGPWAAKAVGAWDDALGGGYLVTTTDPAQADILIEFGSPGSYGRTSLLVPYLPIGTAVPEQVRCGITSDPDHYGDVLDPDYPNELVASVVSMHELGHALGLLDHSCSGALMADAISLELIEGRDEDDWDDIISLTERRAVRVLRTLPQGLALGGYE